MIRSDLEPLNLNFVHISTPNILATFSIKNARYPKHIPIY